MLCEAVAIANPVAEPSAEPNPAPGLLFWMKFTTTTTTPASS